MKFRNLIFISILCVLLCGPCALWVASGEMHLSFPSWLTAEDAKYLSGGISEVDVESKSNFIGFMSGEFQDALETKIENYIPMKANVMLSNAALQRKAIEYSNCIFSWGCYPTYFGSDVFYDSVSQSLCPSPSMYSAASIDKALENIYLFGKELSMFASQNPDIDVCIVVPIYAPNSPLNPTWNLVSRKWNQKDAIEIWGKQTAYLDNVHIVYHELYDYSDYLKYYYRCDSHWNGYGAIDTCEYVIEALNLPPFSNPENRIEILNNYLNYGQLGRRARMLLADQTQLNEPAFEINHFDVSENLNDAQVLTPNNISSQESAYAMFNFYQWYYGDDVSSVIKNKQSPNDEVSLIICDSYGDAFRWALASSCKETYSIYDLHRLSKSHTNLIAHLQDTHATKLVFCACPENYSTFIERYPDYFRIS